MSYRARIAASLPGLHMTHAERGEAADQVLADLEAAGLVIMPAVATNRMRHEACKGAVGITTGTFGLMWSHIVAYCRTLER